VCVWELSAKEFYSRKMVLQSEEMLFTINWRNDINTAALAGTAAVEEWQG